MSSSFERYQRRRLIGSYFSVIISIGLVLFLLGLLGLLVLNTKKAADYFKEQIPLTVYFKDSAKEVEMQQLEKTLELADYVKSIQFVSKEEAAEAQSKEIGEDFVEFLGFNPLQNSIDIHFKAEFVSAQQISEISEDLMENDFVDEVDYDKPLVSIVNSNINRISFWVLVVSAIFLFIAVLLINSSIRLSVYAKRFTIKTMQLVGATKGFIRRPFIWQSVKLGMIGALLAMIGMGFVLYYLHNSFPDLGLIDDPILLAFIFAGVFLLGILLTLISTFLATQRFLNLQTDELYY
ncbi:MAG TPA: permease-like cell division protein FtsX [Flavobacteriaceae bacterium]|nr:permease-like cell division protein FtsX [Flavobacteriaceae bacterium]